MYVLYNPCLLFNYITVQYSNYYNYYMIKPLSFKFLVRLELRTVAPVFFLYFNLMTQRRELTHIIQSVFFSNIMNTHNQLLVVVDAIDCTRHFNFSKRCPLPSYKPLIFTEAQETLLPSHFLSFFKACPCFSPEHGTVPSTTFTHSLSHQPST